MHHNSPKPYASNTDSDTEDEIIIARNIEVDILPDLNAPKDDPLSEEFTDKDKLSRGTIPSQVAFKLE